ALIDTGFTIASQDFFGVADRGPWVGERRSVADVGVAINHRSAFGCSEARVRHSRRHHGRGALHKLPARSSQTTSSLPGSQRSVRFWRWLSTALLVAIATRYPSSKGQFGRLPDRMDSRKFCMWAVSGVLRFTTISTPPGRFTFSGR